MDFLACRDAVVELRGHHWMSHCADVIYVYEDAC